MSAPYLGDFLEDETVHFIWSTNDADGASITRSTDGTVSVYKDNGATPSVAGVTGTEDFDSLTGIHTCTIDLSADAFYAIGANYTVVLSASTIDTQTVNAVLAHFSIENRFAEVAVTSMGANVITASAIDANAIGSSELADGAITESKIAADAITAAKIADDAIAAEHIASAAIVAATFGAGAIDSAAIATNAIDADAIASNAIAAAKIATGAITASKFAAGAIDAAALATDAVNEIVDQTWDETDSDHNTSGSMGVLQNQIANLSSGSASINTPARAEPNGFVITTGTSEANDEDSTHALDGTTHDLEPSGGTTDAYYIFDVGGNGVPVSISWHGFAQSQGDSYAVYAYNWGGTAWEQIGSRAGTAGATVVTETFDLTTSHVGTGANLGLVRFRFQSTDGTKFGTDRILCSYSVVAQSVGYSQGAIWVDTNASNTNTESYVDGVADNPVSTWAAALTIAGNMGLSRFILIGGSSITLSGNSDNYVIEGYGSTVALGGRSVDGAVFRGCIISGNDDGSNTNFTHYWNCEFGTSTLGQHELFFCHFGGNITLAEAGDYLWDHCSSFVAGNGTPDVTFPAGNGALSVRHYSGGMEINSMAAGDTMSYEGFGQFKIAASCTGGDVSIRGTIGPITDAASGAVTLTEDARIDDGTILGAITDDDTQIDASALNTHAAITPASAAEIAAVQTEVDKIGTIPALDGAGQTIGEAIAKIADDNGGADFDATTDSLEKSASAADPATAWDALIASHDTEDSFGNVINDMVQENGGTGVYEYTTASLGNAPSGAGSTQYFVLGAAVQNAENLITWHAYCLKNGAPTAGTDCTVQLYKDDGDGTITEITGATDTVASPDANALFNESMEVTLVAGALYYYTVSMTVDAGTRNGRLSLMVPERTAS